jgi:hypothetical protein
MENAESRQTEIPNFTTFCRNTERGLRDRIMSKKAAPNIVGQLMKCALEPRVAAIKMEIDKTRIKGESARITRRRYQPSQRNSVNSQYQQKATCPLYTDNLPQSDRESKPPDARVLFASFKI